MNRKITLENSPMVTSPVLTRIAPITTRAMLVSVGMSSSKASNQLRMRMARTRGVSTLPASAVSRSVSRASAPYDLMSWMPSKLSCTPAENLPNWSWASVKCTATARS